MGEFALLSDAPRTANVVAVVRTKVRPSRLLRVGGLAARTPARFASPRSRTSIVLQALSLKRDNYRKLEAKYGDTFALLLGLRQTKSKDAGATADWLLDELGLSSS